MSLVSVIIPAYNQARYLPAAIESIFAQDWPEIELIVVDDGSTDATQEVLAGYADRLQVICQENRGLAAARNAGYQAARGEYLLFLDSDDQLVPQAISGLVRSLQETDESQPGLAYSAWQQLDENGSLLLGEMHPGFSGQALEPLLLRQFFFFASGTLLRRDCLEAVGIFRDNLRWSEDADLWLRIARAGYAFVYLDEPLLKYRVHSSSMTARVNPQQVAAWLAGLEVFFAESGHLPEIMALRGQATAILHYETAGRYYRQGDEAQACQHLLAARADWPEAPLDWWLEWAAGTALDPRTLDPYAFLHFAAAQSGEYDQPALLRKLIARYSLAAFHQAFRQNAFGQARRLARRAVMCDWKVIFNRGFLSLCRKTWMHR